MDITVLDIAAVSSVADHFIIASARSRIAVQALADALLRDDEGLLERPLRSEGYAEGRWICLDYGDVVVHLFQEEVRRLFDLERLWGDVPQRHPDRERAVAGAGGA